MWIAFRNPYPSGIGVVMVVHFSGHEVQYYPELKLLKLDIHRQDTLSGSAVFKDYNSLLKLIISLSISCV